MLTILLAALAAAAPAPSAEAEALGRRLAATGLLETLLPTIAAKETEEISQQHPELSDAERAALRTTSGEVAARLRARLSEAVGHEYAKALSVPDLRRLVAFAETPAAQHYRDAVPGVTVRGLAGVGQVDFKGEVAKAFCARTGKLCPH
jgi:hypothetical protein